MDGSAILVSGVPHLKREFFIWLFHNVYSSVKSKLMVSNFKFLKCKLFWEIMQPSKINTILDISNKEWTMIYNLKCNFWWLKKIQSEKQTLHAFRIIRSNLLENSASFNCVAFCNLDRHMKYKCYLPFFCHFFFLLINEISVNSGFVQSGIFAILYNLTFVQNINYNWQRMYFVILLLCSK